MGTVTKSGALAAALFGGSVGGGGSGSGVNTDYTQAQLDAMAVAGTLDRLFYSPNDVLANVPVYWSPDPNTLEPQGQNVNYVYDTGVVAVSDAADTLLGTYNVKGAALFTVRALNNHASAALATFIVKEVSPSGRETTYLGSGQATYGAGFPSRDWLDLSSRLKAYATDEALPVGSFPTDFGALPAQIEGRATVITNTARTFKVYARFPTGTSATNRSLTVYAEAQSAGV